MSSFSFSSSPLISLLFYTILFAIPIRSYPLDNICKQTKNPPFCFKILGPYSNASLQELDQLLIDTTISNVTQTIAKIKSLLSQTKDPNVRTVYSLCSNYYGAALDALEGASEKLQAGRYGDLNGAASTISQDVSSCQNAFSFAPSQQIAIASDNKKFDLLSNVFAVVSRILSGSV